MERAAPCRTARLTDLLFVSAAPLVREGHGMPDGVSSSHSIARRGGTRPANCRRPINGTKPAHSCCDITLYSDIFSEVDFISYSLNNKGKFHATRKLEFGGYGRRYRCTSHWPRVLRKALLRPGLGIDGRSKPHGNTFTRDSHHYIITMGSSSNPALH